MTPSVIRPCVRKKARRSASVGAFFRRSFSRIPIKQKSEVLVDHKRLFMKPFAQFVYCRQHLWPSYDTTFERSLAWDIDHDQAQQNGQHALARNAGHRKNDA